MSETKSKIDMDGDNNDNKIPKKEIAKAYEKYSDQFTPKPKYFMNSFRAFLVGGALCAVSLWMENKFMDMGVSEKNAGIYVILILIMTAQLLTGLGFLILSQNLRVQV